MPPPPVAGGTEPRGAAVPTAGRPSRGRAYVGTPSFFPTPAPAPAPTAVPAPLVFAVLPLRGTARPLPSWPPALEAPDPLPRVVVPAPLFAPPAPPRSPPRETAYPPPPEPLPLE